MMPSRQKSSERDDSFMFVNKESDLKVESSDTNPTVVVVSFPEKSSPEVLLAAWVSTGRKHREREGLEKKQGRQFRMLDFNPTAKEVTRSNLQGSYS
jgi:hypothetical protein